MAAEFEVYTDKAGEYRWRLQANNNEIVADSNEGYTSKASCLHGIDVVKRIAAEAPSTTSPSEQTPAIHNEPPSTQPASPWPPTDDPTRRQIATPTVQDVAEPHPR